MSEEQRERKAFWRTAKKAKEAKQTYGLTEKGRELMGAFVLGERGEAGRSALAPEQKFRFDFAHTNGGNKKVVARFWKKYIKVLLTGKEIYAPEIEALWISSGGQPTDGEWIKERIPA
jgi:hypothetical protein